MTARTEAEWQQRVAAIEAAQPAPESFDATAALRRVMALVRSWDDATREFYYENRHTHENGIEYVAGYEDGWNHAAELLDAAIRGDL